MSWLYQISILILKTQTSTSMPDGQTIKTAGITRSEQFNKQCAQTLLQLQRLRLRAHLMGCKPDEEEFHKYYQYYTQRPRRRFEICRRKIDGLVRAYQLNQKYLEGLELKTINSMLKIYRKRMNLSMKQPIDIELSKLQKEEDLLNRIIVTGDHSRTTEVHDILAKIKIINEQIANPKEKNNQTQSRQNLRQVLRTIDKAEVRYFRYFQTFERSIANIVNQIHSHMQKLGDFYNMWENLGSSLIYEMKSDREVYIDKTLQQKRGGHLGNFEEGEEEIAQVIQVMPAHSKTRQQYEQRLQNLKSRSMRVMLSNQNFGSAMSSKSWRGNLKLASQGITKCSWYETESEDIRQCSSVNSMMLRERENGYFRYTYEELKNETRQYLTQIKANESHKNENHFDRFYVFCEKRQAQEDHTERVPKVNNFPHMSFDCWFDRINCKGVFSIQDFPANLFQRKLQFEADRQVEMLSLDERRKKQYKSKESKLQGVLNQTTLNIGFKESLHLKEIQKLRLKLTEAYDVLYFPELKPSPSLHKQMKQDFSDSNSQPQQGPKHKNKDKDKQEDKKQLGKHSQSQQFKQKSKLNKNRQQINSKGSSVEQMRKAYPWLTIKCKQKQVFECFVQSYLPQMEKAICAKILSDQKKKGYEEEEIQPVQFRYLPNFEQTTIQECSTQFAYHNSSNKTDLGSANKLFLVSKDLYVKLEPLFFPNGRQIVKIMVVLFQESGQIDNLKQNLVAIFCRKAQHKLCINTDYLNQSDSQESKIFGMVGHIIHQMKIDRNTKSIMSQKDQKWQQLIKEGSKVYGAYKQHFARCQALTE